MKKIFHIIIWVLLIGWFSIIMSFVSASNGDVLCRNIEIQISDSSDVRFVTSNEIRELINASGMDIQGYPIEAIRTRELEYSIEKDPYVANAEVYIDVEGTLHADIQQRKPVIRIMPGGTEGYYLDREGSILPLKKGYTPMVLLCSGYMKTIGMDKVSSGAQAQKVEQEISWLIDFAEYVNQDPFWSNQIVQLYRDRNGDYEIIPRVGAHQVILGSLQEYDKKLRNLELLYEQGFSKYGWNTYSKINLKYSKQIICTKR